MDASRMSPRRRSAGRRGLRSGATTLMITMAGAVMAQADAAIEQANQAAREGHVAQAQRMMVAVLRDHPNSARAHFVEAELLARQAQFAKAREEFDTAERLAPGLPFARADAVQALRRDLAPTHTRTAGSSPAGGHWGIAAALAGGALLAWLLARLGRPQPAPVPVPPAAWPGAGAAGATPAAPAAADSRLDAQITAGAGTAATTRAPVDSDR